MDVIEVENLSKDYRQHFWTPRRRVLDSVSFSVHQGEIFGFLGPNGSGKSTTIKILFQIIFQTSGTARIFGKALGDPDAKRRIGFLPENSYFYEYLTSKQFLSFHGKLWGLTQVEVEKRIPQTLEMVGMKGTENLMLRYFSKGMLQRIGLAQAIIHDPDLVILDEPMTGLDPVGRKEVRDLMILLKERGKTVFFSTHILTDVESVCDRVAILNKGKLLKCGSLDQLISLETKYVDMTWKNVSSSFHQYLEKTNAKIMGSSESVSVKFFPESNESVVDFERRLQQVVAKGLENKASLHSLSPKQESLEDIFMRQIGSMESRI